MYRCTRLNRVQAPPGGGAVSHFAILRPSPASPRLLATPKPTDSLNKRRPRGVHNRLSRDPSYPPNRLIESRDGVPKKRKIASSRLRNRPIQSRNGVPEERKTIFSRPRNRPIQSQNGVPEERRIARITKNIFAFLRPALVRTKVSKISYAGLAGLGWAGWGPWLPSSYV